MKNLPAVGSQQSINNGDVVIVLGHGTQNGTPVAICQDGEFITICTAEAFDAPKPDYKGHANLAEMISGHLAALQCALDDVLDRATLDDVSWWEQELKALADIEAAVRAELM